MSKQIKTTLYALNKDGGFQEWKVFVDEDLIEVHFGKLDGKIQVKETKCKGKNIGKANETTDAQQAELEAISKWEKQFRLGYRESTLELEVVESLSPMLAADAKNKSHMIVYPAFVQPKLDGLRCLVTFDEKGEPVFNSRGNKTYPIQGDIVEELRQLKMVTRLPMYDGEVYIHGLSLQKISSLAKKWRTQEQIQKEIDKDFEGDKKRQAKAIKDGNKSYKDFDGNEVSVLIDPIRDDNRYDGYESSDLEFRLFDIPSRNKVWYDGGKEDRLMDLLTCKGFIYDLKLTKIQVVDGEWFDNEDSVKDSIAIHMQDGYEGSIIRNSKGAYEFGQRSNDMQKWKIFQNIEVKVESVEEDKNGEGVLNCVLQSGVRVRCKMKGTNKYRSAQNMLKLVDKFITISFQSYTDDGVPQFPVGINERDVNPDTWEVLE